MTTPNRPAPRPRLPIQTGGPRTGIFTFFRETIAELRRVTWPTREEAIRLTYVVLAISGSVAVILSVVDLIFNLLLDTFVLPR